MSDESNDSSARPGHSSCACDWPLQGYHSPSAHKRTFIGRCGSVLDRNPVFNAFSGFAVRIFCSSFSMLTRQKPDQVPGLVIDELIEGLVTDIVLRLVDASASRNELRRPSFLQLPTYVLLKFHRFKTGSFGAPLQSPFV